MKKYKGLIIANGIVLGLDVLFYVIMEFVSLIQIYAVGVDFGIQRTFQFLFELFFLAVILILTFLIQNNRVYIVPVGAFVIYAWGINAIELVSYILYPRYYSWTCIPYFVFLTAILIMSIIIFVFAKPFSKHFDEEVDECKEKNYSLEDISKAKELLDAGAITNEEFYEIKRRCLK